MRKFLLLLLTVLFISVFQINAKDFDELIGKTVIINVADEALSPYVYTYEALEKNKFKYCCPIKLNNIKNAWLER